jgi:hypothetical protein
MAPSNYGAIRRQQRERYGTVGAQKSGQLAAERYDDRTHFIFELLQNAEDALRRRRDWQGLRRVTFELTPARLRMSHFGQPFDEADVRSVCEFAESTKDASSIGRFGIGFKSVYTISDRPEIHSGDEDFAIEGYVFPHRVARTDREVDETTIVLPFKTADASVAGEIADALRGLDPNALLFLQHIDEIEWTIEGGGAGVYLRGAPESLGDAVQRIRVISQQADEPEVDQHWLVFHRDVTGPSGVSVGRIGLAFSLVPDPESDTWTVELLTVSPLVVYFPTVVSTNLGVLVQGPYSTTPSRDNVPRNDPWNQRLVIDTAHLLVTAVRWLRDNDMLDVSALRCLPLDRSRFPEGAMFTPLFEVVRQAFLTEALLPRFGGGFATAGQARLARTQELRELFDAEQLGTLFGTAGCAWLTSDITQDRAPELRRYLLQELQVPEVTPEQVVVKLDRQFLEAQTDEWITRLYVFLGTQRALASRLATLPLIRLEDGTHVTAKGGSRATAFLPGPAETSFPTVRRSVCEAAEAREFLVSLGLREPDPVDDVIRNVLPRYQASIGKTEPELYARDIERIRIAFNTDSKAQREKLVEALRETRFVMVVDARDGKGYASKPGEAYMATDRLKALFAGVPEVSIVDGQYDCLRGEEVRDLLVACGASRYLAPEPATSALTSDELTQMRKSAGLERATWGGPPEDLGIRGLTGLLKVLKTLPPSEARERAGTLWEALADLQNRSPGAFYGSYRWGYSHEVRVAQFDAAFVHQLNRESWVPDAAGELVPPALVTFESLGWRPNPVLQAKIAFKPPIIDQLAKEVGIEPAALDLLRKLGITSVADLARLGIATSPAVPPQDSPATEADHAEDVPSESEGAELVKDAAEDAAALDAAVSADIGTNGPADASPDTAHEAQEQEGHAEDPGPASSKSGATGRDRPLPAERGQKDGARPRQRSIAGQSGLEDQSRRLNRRLSSFFDGAARDADEEDAPEDASVPWQARLVCFEAAAGGLHLEVGPLNGLPSFVKKLRAVGSGDWDAFVLATNARLRPTRVMVRPGAGPWQWEAVGFEDEDDLGLDQLALGALDVTIPHVFRVDAAGVGQHISSMTLSPGQAYLLLLPPDLGDGQGAEFDARWRIWSLDLEVQPSADVREALKALGLSLGEACPRLEWAVIPMTAWRTNARGASYPLLESGTELLVNVTGLAVEQGEECMLFLHGPRGTEWLSLSSSGLVSLGVTSVGRWACSLVLSRPSVPPTTLVFEVAQGASEHISAGWAVSPEAGRPIFEATVPPGWPVSVRWGGLASYEETIANVHGNDDRTVPTEDIQAALEARAARTQVADVIVDLRELGRRTISLSGRPSLREVHAQLLALWEQRSETVRARKGMWLQLMPVWFEPAATRLGYGIDALAMSSEADLPHDLAVWLLTIDERTPGGITRSASRVLVLTTDIDSVLRDQRGWIDDACTCARVRDAIVTDGTRWARHRKGDRLLRRQEWSMAVTTDGELDAMLNEVMEGM